MKISRRDTLRYLTIAGLSTGLLNNCRPGEGHEEHDHSSVDGFTGLTEEDKKLLGEKFFTDAERETARVLANQIIPADDRSGNAEAAGCIPFIEFMALYLPDQMAVPLQGGLKWLDNECLKRFDKPFTACTDTEQRSLLDMIAFPDTAPPELSQGVAFFNLFRNLVATGFWSSKMGIEDLEYLGNRPTVWNGPPDEWVQTLGVGDLM
jgi:hypothetical protein